MSNEKKQLHIRLSQIHIDILDELKEKKVGINSYAEAIRYAILSLADKEIINNPSRDIQIKLNAMARNIDVLTEMVAGSFHEQGIKAIKEKEKSYVYLDAKKHVENSIERATTIKSNFKQSNISDSQVDKELPSRNFY